MQNRLVRITFTQAYILDERVMSHNYNYLCSSMAYHNEAQEQPQGQQYPAPIVYYPGPTINYQQPAIKHFGKHYARKTSFGLGITQIVLACASIAAGIMAYEYAAEYYNIGIGMWAGTWVSQFNFSTSRYIVTVYIDVITNLWNIKPSFSDWWVVDVGCQ